MIEEFIITTTESTAGRYALHARGELDVATSPKLAGELRSLASHDVTLDLSGVTFFDSNGLKVLLEARQQADAAAGRLTISALSPPVRRVLELTGCDRAFELTSSS
jgi:anti-anti-sigma factor